MGFLWFGGAKRSIKEASSDATQIKRLFEDSRRLAHDMEDHLQHILHTVPSQLEGDEFRKLEAHLEITKRHVEETRKHIERLDEHIRQIDEHLQHAREHAQREQAQHTEQRAA